eukprot:CAMPEP_0117652610 /NCGR_PEP_ID=MMETSP0804-20121206/2721_1 /TAXON_ID=1074897 /ORGANISM="Tetraselmis astigmatica, Strain CCMP880" /LENGTH=342 /DNA_ID=CAMNT_0005458673 /DNA_START=424 /DNA_END=1452 /DNA_ORIENTATION=-
MAATISGTTLPLGRASRWRSAGRDRPRSVSVRAVTRDVRDPSRAMHPPANYTVERVLRYPGGRERRIRYPLPRPPNEDPSDDHDDGFLGDDFYWGGPNELAWGGPTTFTNRRKSSPKDTSKQRKESLPPKKRAEPPLTPTASSTEAHSETEAAKRFFDAMWDLPTATPAAQPAAKADEIPASPAGLLRHITSDGYKKAQEDLSAKVARSYEVLTECPWVLPRKVFCLAADSVETEKPKSYSLRTRMDIEGAADEMSKVFRKSKPGIGKKFQFNKVVDGLIVFEDAEDAGDFKAHLKDDGYLQVGSTSTPASTCKRPAAHHYLTSHTHDGPPPLHPMGICHSM